MWKVIVRHLPLRSVDFDNHWFDLCGQGPDRFGEDVDKFSAKAPQLFPELQRTLEYNHGNDFIWCLGFASSGRISNASVFHSILQFDRESAVVVALVTSGDIELVVAEDAERSSDHFLQA